MNDLTKIIVGGMIGAIIPVIGTIWYISSAFTAYDINIKNNTDNFTEMQAETKENFKILSTKIDGLSTIATLENDVANSQRQISRQWEMIGELKTTIDQREYLIKDSKEKIADLEERLRTLEIETKTLRKINSFIQPEKFEQPIE